MLKFKKIIFSVSLLGISLLTMVATTFAWVGITSNSVFDEFSINLKTDNDTGNYGVQLSLSGVDGSFSDSIDGIEVRRQIMKNSGNYDNNALDIASDDKINVWFSQYEMGQCTPCKSSAYPNLFSYNNVQLFEDVLAEKKTKAFMYFDVYAAIYVAKSTGSSSESTAPIQLFLRDSILSSDEIGEWKVRNPYTYPTTPITIGGVSYNSPLAGWNIQNVVKVNPASAARVCIQKFAPIDMYTGTTSTPVDYTIYKYDGDLPSYDNATGVYSFGGIIPAEHNMAQQQYMLARPGSVFPTVPDWQINRGDTIYEDRENIGRIVDTFDGLTVGKKIKFRVYFWFEGWDADCFEVIDRKNVKINLSFSNKAISIPAFKPEIYSRFDFFTNS